MKNNVLLLLGILLATVAFAEDNPKAKTESTVVFGPARFTVLAPELIRMEYDSAARFEDRASLVFINRETETPAFKKRISGHRLTLRTDKLLLQYTDNGQAFSADNLSITLMNGKKEGVTWRPGMQDTLNLKGTFRTLDGVDGWGNIKNMEQGLISRSGWALVDDSRSNLFDGDPDWNWVVQRPEGAIDWYFFGYGHNYKKALSDFTRIAGKIPMPPKYAFGYWWSRYWIYNDDEIRSLVNQMKAHDIPIDVFIIDMDWHETWGLTAMPYKADFRGWTGYTWNRRLFPHPEKLLDWLDTQHLKTALNLHPAGGIAPMEAQYADFAHAYGFDTTGQKTIPFNMSDKKWAKTYFDIVLRPMEQQGVDFWWLDWQQWAEDTRIKNLSNTWWLNYTFFTRMQKKGTDRPLLFHRWGGMGNHRYQIGFSGDSHVSWASLDFQLYFTPTASNVGYGYWSHDIGGHQGEGDTDGELYLRWLQFGALSPILRTHCSKWANLERRFWMFPNHFEEMHAALKLRYALAPYIYKNSREAYDSGISICRPMYYDYPEQEEAYTARTQYMFGSDMLAAPISSPIAQETELASRQIWLPEGEWFEYLTGTLIEGDTSLTRTYALHEIPLFFKAGSIIPLYGDINTLQVRPEKQIVCLTPGGPEKVVTTLYEDDGTTDGYIKGEYTTRQISRELVDSNTLLVKIAPTQGQFAGMAERQTLELVLPNTMIPASVTVNGQTVTPSYDTETLSSVITLSELSSDAEAEIEILFDQPLVAQQIAFNGNRGFMKRLAKAIAALKYSTAKVDFAVGLPNDLEELSNIRNVLRYHPDQAYPLMEKLNGLKINAGTMIRNIPDAAQEELNAKAEYVSQ